MFDELSQIHPEVLSEADRLDYIVRQVLGPETPLRRLIITFLCQHATWIGGAVAIRLAELTADDEQKRSRLAADALARLADELALPLAGKLQDQERFCREECAKALKVCVPYLTPFRRQELAIALWQMIVRPTDRMSRASCQ